MENSKISSTRQNKIFRKGCFSGRGKIITLGTENPEILDEFTENAEILNGFFPMQERTSKFQDSVLQIHWFIIFLALPLMLYWDFKTIHAFLSLEMLLVEKPLAFHEYELARLLKKSKLQVQGSLSRALIFQ